MVSYIHPKIEFNSQGDYMMIKRTTTHTKSYDEKGQLILEETIVEEEFDKTFNPPYPQYPLVGDQWWRNPVISSSNTDWLNDMGPEPKDWDN
jgi:hypothetical protein